VLNYIATNVAPTQKDQPLISSKRKSVPKHINGFETNKNRVMSANGTQNQEGMCWRTPAAVYFDVVLRYFGREG
jgi:hypothetical protein